jgi:glutamate decarboxylase
MLSKKRQETEIKGDEELAPTYASRDLSHHLPKWELPTASSSPATAYQVIHDELNLDGNPTLNLATFVTTWMDSEADRLMTETLGKNLVDADEYPQTLEIQDRCVNIIARLFHAPKHLESVGTATVGSSEAIHLAGLAMKWRWRARREAEGHPTDRPNIVMGHNVQVCWEKFARYFDVEPRYVPLTEDRFVLGVQEAIAMVDENTIGVVGILGSTYTGEYEPIEALDAAISELNSKQGWQVPIHVDAASGGFVAPFLQPSLKWDFRLPNVVSINTSGHKYGLVYPGVGWVIWRDSHYLPEDLIFHVNYLGGDHPTFNLNFSRGAGQILAQYYNFLRLGREGYEEVMHALADTSHWLAARIEKLGPFKMIARGTDLPLVCFRLEDPNSPYSVFDLSEELRARGWIVPAYTMAPNAEHIAVLRVVVREGLSRDLAGKLVEDMQRAIQKLSSRPPVTPTHKKEPKGAPASVGKEAKVGHKTHGVC